MVALEMTSFPLLLGVAVWVLTWPSFGWSYLGVSDELRGEPNYSPGQQRVPETIPDTPGCNSASCTVVVLKAVFCSLLSVV
mgnify:CR=1 FL=1